MYLGYKQILLGTRFQNRGEQTVGETYVSPDAETSMNMPWTTFCQTAPCKNLMHFCRLPSPEKLDDLHGELPLGRQ